MNALSTALQLFDLSGKVDTISSDSFKKIYKVYSKDGVYFLRLCNDQVYNKEEIESEISFLEILRNSGFNTMSAKKSINELSTEYIQTENNNVIATCCREVIGHHLRFHEFNNSYFYSLGELTAKLHVQSSLINQKKVNLQRPIAYQRAFRLFEKHSNHMDFNLFRKCVHLYDQFSSLEKKEDSFGLIHTDITRNNIILNGREYYLIDLGDLSYSWFINDVAITLYDNLLHGSVKEDKYSKFVSNFMFHYWKGYFQFREPKEKMLELIPKFMHYRAIHDHIYLQVIWKNININVDQKAYYEKIKNMAHEGFDFLSINHFN